MEGVDSEIKSKVKRGRMISFRTESLKSRVAAEIQQNGEENEVTDWDTSELMQCDVDYSAEQTQVAGSLHPSSKIEESKQHNRTETHAEQRVYVRSRSRRQEAGTGMDERVDRQATSGDMRCNFAFETLLWKAGR